MPASDAVVLPAGVRPRHYRLTLRPDLKSFTFSGNAVIEVELAEPTRTITMNAAELEVASASLSIGGETVDHRSIALNAEAETVALSFPLELPPGPAQLSLAFTGELNNKLLGFYRSEYQTPEGETRYLATTQFEATDARRAFPCWDEPAAKAVFEVTLEFDQQYQAVSNTPAVEETRPRPGIKAVRFAPTPVMSTYLLAFVVGDLTAVEAEAADGTLVRVWTTPGKENQAGFALDTSVKLLGYFNDYFGIPYPLPKLDHLAIPDFAAGAMENWGAVTYRETALLVDPANSSAGTRQRVAEVVAHEMAHMWFGDLVTMEWWDDLWLNESFASWMGTKAVDWLFPEWEMWTQFVNMDTSRALSLDGLTNSHPIEQEVKNPAEVSQLFDAISYSKGASVLRMLEQFLGPETFRQGLNRYLSNHQYANARGEHLWTALQEESGRPVVQIMDSWIKQMGYPVLQVAAERAGGQVNLSLSQQRFLYDAPPENGADGGNGAAAEAGDGGPLWQVPVRVAAGGAAAMADTVLDGRQAQLAVPAGPQEWFKVNAGQTGFYRVNYAPDDWRRLAPAVQALELPATDRLGIQNDAYALSRAGLLPVSRFLELAGAYVNETDASVWSDLASNLRDIEQLIGIGELHPAYQRFARGLFGPAARRIGWQPQPGEGHLDSLLRSTVLSQAGSYEDPEMLRQASGLFGQFLSDAEAVPPDLRGVVFSLAAQAGDAATYDALWDLEARSPLQEEQIRLLLALARFRQPELLQRTLESSLTPRVRSQDTITVVAAVAANLRGRDLAWEFVKDHWGEFDRRYGSGGFGLMRLVSICGNFNTAERQSDVESFFAEHPAPAAERTIRQALERVRLNINWLENHRADLSAWVAAQG